MKCKAAYYLPAMPTKMAVVLTDGRAKITNITPLRSIREDELEDLAALKLPAYLRALAKPENEILESTYHLYDLEKEG